MTKKEGFNPFRKTPEGNDPKIIPELRTYLDEFLAQAKIIITFASPNVPEDLKEAVLETLTFTDVELMAKEIGNNDHNAYADYPIRKQFVFWMRRNVINRELGDLKDLAFKNEKLSDGQKLEFSQLTVEITALLYNKSDGDEVEDTD